ncbi:MerR family transcriptional regulator [Kosakonia cowanii]
MPKPSAGCRNGLRRQYPQSVLNKLQLIALGQAAGFSLDEMAAIKPAGQGRYQPRATSAAREGN